MISFPHRYLHSPRNYSTNGNELRSYNNNNAGPAEIEPDYNDSPQASDPSFGSGHLVMIIVCTLLGTMLLLIGVWFCCTLYADFCADGREEVDEKRRRRGRSGHRRRRSYNDDSYYDLSRSRSRSRSRISTVSQPRRSHFSGSGRRPSYCCSRYLCRSSRHRHRGSSSRQKYPRYDDSSSFYHRVAPFSPRYTMPDEEEYSESLSSSRSERGGKRPPGLGSSQSYTGTSKSVPTTFSQYVSSGGLFPPPPPGTTSQVSYSAAPAPHGGLTLPKFAKYTKKQKKFSFKINSGGGGLQPGSMAQEDSEESD